MKEFENANRIVFKSLILGLKNEFKWNTEIIENNERTAALVI